MTLRTSIKTNFPGDLAVVTCAAKLALSDCIHRDLICAYLHLKNGRVAGIALEPDPVKPVRKNGRRHPSFTTRSLKNDVALDGKRHASKKDGDQKKRQQNRAQRAGSREQGVQARGQRSEVRDQMSEMEKVDLRHFRLTSDF
jgi:hypothetical protein